MRTHLIELDRDSRRDVGLRLTRNLDTTVHLFRQPTDDWIGYDTTVSFGPGGAGLTHTVLHDRHGPLGTASQTLTISSGDERVRRDRPSACTPPGSTRAAARLP